MKKALPTLPSICLMGNMGKNIADKICSTQIGGMPYIPNNSKYPVDEK